MIEAVVFDLDGVLIESEQLWNATREGLARDLGGSWTEPAARDMMGMSSREWSRYMHDRLGVALAPEEISAEAVRRMEERYRASLPLLPGAGKAVERVGARWPLAIASSSNPPLIALVLEASGLACHFRVWVSSEQVAHGKPAPDVYLEATRRLGVDPRASAAIEDSTNGLLAARAAEMRVVAIPNRAFPPSEQALEGADVVLRSLDELTPQAIERTP